MGDRLAVPEFDDLVGEQLETPPGASLRLCATSERGDVGALRAVDLDRTS